MPDVWHSATPDRRRSRSSPRSWRKPMLTAADVMTTNVISVTPETPIREVAKLMHSNRISGVPVIDREKHVIGIVSEGDLIRHAEVVGEQRQSWWLAAFTS